MTPPPLGPPDPGTLPLLDRTAEVPPASAVPPGTPLPPGSPGTASLPVAPVAGRLATPGRAEPAAAAPEPARDRNRYKNGCRCQACRDAYAAHMRQRRADAREAADSGTPLPPGFRHGTRYGFEERGCRCTPCRVARNSSLYSLPSRKTRPRRTA